MVASAVYSLMHLTIGVYAPIYVQLHVCQASREHHVARELGRTIMITKLVFVCAFCEQEKSNGKLKFSP